MGSGKILVLTFLALVFVVCSAGAATIVVNQGDSIQAAINNAGDGDVIKIGAGNYNELIVIAGFDKLTITGAGQGETIIDGNTLPGNVVTISNSRKIIFQNCTVKNAGNFSDNFHLQKVDTVVITKCTIEYAASANGIYCIDSNRVCIKNCLVQQNASYGVIFQNVYNSCVLKSVIDSNDTAGILITACHNTIVSGNTITNNIAIGIYNDGQNTLVKKNTVSDNGYGLYHIGTDTFGNVYANNVINGNGFGVYVINGFPTFSGNLIDGNQEGFRSDIGAYSTLIKNTISNSWGGRGVYLKDSSGYLSQNKLTGNSTDGVRHLITTSAYLPSRILTLTGNKITANEFFGVASSDSTNQTVLDARKNYIVGNDDYGFEIGVEGVFIDKNTVGANFGYGIYLDPASPATVTKNFVNGNLFPGIRSGSRSVIYGNRVYANHGSGITFFSNSYVAKNTVLSNHFNGIDATGSSGSLIENNKSYGNGDGMTYFDLYDPLTNDIWSINKYGTADL